MVPQTLRVEVLTVTVVTVVTGNLMPRSPQNPRSAAAPRTPARPKRTVNRTLEDRLEELFAGIAVSLQVAGQGADAAIVAQQAEPMAAAWGDLARQNAKVKEILERIVSGGAWGAVFLATASVAIPIAQNHGWYPEDWPMPFSVKAPGHPPTDTPEPTAAQREAAIAEARRVAEEAQRAATDGDDGSREPPSAS